jgi:hypothetical protein
MRERMGQKTKKMRMTHPQLRWIFQKVTKKTKHFPRMPPHPRGMLPQSLRFLPFLL